ncbi:hypothetical protein ACFXJ5_26995 [Streptomyces sp. NPDC059373]
MAEDFETILKAGSAEYAARTSPRPAEAVRARGDQLRRHHRAATVALAVAVVAAVGGGAFVATGHLSRHSAQPPAATSSATIATTSCRSLVASQSVKDAVTQAYRLAQPGLVHIAPVKGTFYYGACGDVSYAGARFTPTSGSTAGEQVALQDAGSVEKYFTKSPNGMWTYVATDGFPASTHGCAAIPQIPAALAALWADCRHG